MSRKIRNSLLLGIILLLAAGCTTLAPAPTVQPAATLAPQTPTVIYVVVTATPEATALPTETPEATATTMATETAIPVIVQPTNTAVAATQKVVPTAVPAAFDADGKPVKASSSILITNITYTGEKKARIDWKATGENPRAFWIYYSTSYKLPFYGGYPEYMVDSTARSAYVDGDLGSTVYYRICYYNGSGCDFYSNSYTFTYPSN